MKIKNIKSKVAAKVAKIAKKTATKIAKSKVKVAAKTGGNCKGGSCCSGGKCSPCAVALVLALAATLCGCMGTTTPSRSQSLTIKDCTFNIYGSGEGTTNDVARVEIASQGMQIENSGTETQTATPTNTVDVPVQIDARYNDAMAGATVASKGVLDTLTDAAKAKVLSLMADKTTGTVEVQKKDGTTATVKCEGGQCSFCEDCTPTP